MKKIKKTKKIKKIRNNSKFTNFIFIDLIIISLNIRIFLLYIYSILKIKSFKLNSLLSFNLSYLIFKDVNNFDKIEVFYIIFSLDLEFFKYNRNFFYKYNITLLYF